MPSYAEVTLFTSCLSTSFDSIAEAYDRARPEYPQQIFDRILEYAQLPHFPADVLEIGAGTGKATRPLASLGHRLVCLEPGPNLARFARGQFASLTNVLFQEVSFEHWEPDERRFDIVFSAQAFHWLDPARRLPKLAKVIRPGGALAIFGHSSDVAPPHINDAIQSAYQVCAPTLIQQDNAKSWYSSTTSPVTGELEACPLFEDLDFHVVEWSRELSSDAYCELLCTYSDHLALPSSQREALLAAVRDAICGNGDAVRLDYHTGLFLARAVGC